MKVETTAERLILVSGSARRHKWLSEGRSALGVSSRVSTVLWQPKAHNLRATRLVGWLFTLAVGEVVAPSAQAGCDDHLFRMPSPRKSAKPGLGMTQLPVVANPLPQPDPLPAPCHGPRCSHLPEQKLPVPTAPAPSTGDDHAWVAATLLLTRSGPWTFVQNQPIPRPLYFASPLERPPRRPSLDAA